MSMWRVVGQSSALPKTSSVIDSVRHIFRQNLKPENPAHKSRDQKPFKESECN